MYECIESQALIYKSIMSESVVVSIWWKELETALAAFTDPANIAAGKRRIEIWGVDEEDKPWEVHLIVK